MRSLPHTHSCFVCGDSNPLGLHLRFQTDGQIVRGEFIPRPEHIGFKQTVHGGVIATVLDEAMAWACAALGKQFGFCAELTVRYQQPVRPETRTFVIGRLISNRRSRFFVAGAELQSETGTVLATGEGKYLAIKEADRTAFMTDLVGDATVLEEPNP